MKKFINIIIFLCIWAYAIGQDTLRLGTSTVEGNYYRLGLSIDSILVRNKFDENIEVLNTEGSVDNIFKLINNEIDLAIVQNDIAFLAENGLFPFKKSYSNLRGAITFYPEPIFLICNRFDIHNIEQLATYKVNLGLEKSGLLADAKIILNSINLYEEIKPAHYKPSQIMSLLISDEIQAAFVNNIDSKMASAINEDKLFIVPLNKKLIDSLIKTYPYFDEFTIKIKDENVSTIAVKSILISKKDIDEKKIYKLVSILYDDYNMLNVPNFMLKSKITCQMSLKKWHRGALNYYNEIGILKSQTLLQYLWLLLFIPMVFIILFIVMNLVFIYINRKYPLLISANSRFLKFIKKLNLVFSKNKYVLIVVMMVTILLTDIIVVQHVEHNWAIKSNVTSKFDNNSFYKNLIWLFVFSGSGYNDSMFPISPLGKLLVTLVPLIGIGGIVSIIGLATSDHIKRKILEARGVQIRMIRDHIILCGWNENVPFLIKNMLHDNIAYKRPIVLLANISEEMPLEKFGINDKMVSYINGDATNRIDLTRANLKDADIAIIVSDSNSPDADAKNILKVLTIETFCKELEEKGIRKNRENIYTIAEINDPNKYKLAYDAHVDEIILSGNIRSKILVQSVLNPGVSKFINEILTYNEYNDIYSTVIRKGSNLVGLTFDELLIKFRKYKILLLSINVNENNEPEKHGLKRYVITNPIDDAEIKYRTNEGDRLIVLAQYEKVVNSAVKKIEKYG